jgi:hypothetical protein
MMGPSRVNRSIDMADLAGIEDFTLKKAGYAGYRRTAVQICRQFSCPALSPNSGVSRQFKLNWIGL